MKYSTNNVTVKYCHNFSIILPFAVFLSEPGRIYSCLMRTIYLLYKTQQQNNCSQFITSTALYLLHIVLIYIYVGFKALPYIYCTINKLLEGEEMVRTV